MFPAVALAIRVLVTELRCSAGRLSCGQGAEPEGSGPQEHGGRTMRGADAVGVTAREACQSQTAGAGVREQDTGDCTGLCLNSGIRASETLSGYKSITQVLSSGHTGEKAGVCKPCPQTCTCTHPHTA